jgi:hypothetical protein
LRQSEEDSLEGGIEEGHGVSISSRQTRVYCYWSSGSCGPYFGG